MTISVNLPPDIEARLLALASNSGQSTDAQLQQIIDHGLGNLEDYYAAREVLGKVERGEEQVLSSEEFWRGMDH